MVEATNNLPNDAQPASEHARQTQSDGEPEIVLLFIYRLLPDAKLETLGKLWTAMYTLATSDPGFGFLSASGFTAKDDTRIEIYRFSSLAGLMRFRSHPEHIAVQRRGGEFFERIRNEICTVNAVHLWTPARS